MAMLNAADYEYEPTHHPCDDDELSLAESEDDDYSETDPLSAATPGARGGGGAFAFRERAPSFLSSHESKAVDWLRGAVIAALATAILLVSAIVHNATSNAERFEFTEAFEDASTTVFESFRETVERKLGAVDGLALDLSSYARISSSGADGNPSWPMVTLPDFAVRGASTIGLAGTVSVMLLPLVADRTRSTWEEYSVQHADWLEEGMRWEKEVLASENDDGHSRSLSKWHKKKKSASTAAAAAASGPSSLSAQPSASSAPEVTPPDDYSMIPEHIFNLHGPMQEGTTGPFFPLWQTVPVRSNETSEWVNFDMLSLEGFRGGLKALLESNRAVVGEVSNLVEPRQKRRQRRGDAAAAAAAGMGSTTVSSEKQETRKSFQLLWHALLSRGDGDGGGDGSGIGDLTAVNRDRFTPDEPVSPLFYPVFDRPCHYKTCGRQGNVKSSLSSSSLVAVVATMMSWRQMLSDIILPQSAEGGVVVVIRVSSLLLREEDEDEEQQREQQQQKQHQHYAFTYQISGKEVEFLGTGDLHSPKFDSMAKSMNLFGGNEATQGPGEPTSTWTTTGAHHQYRSVPLDREYCDYTVTVYPSQEMRDAYVTNGPLFYTALVAFIFLCFSLVFAAYDCLVERRQKVVVSRALRSTAIVSQLFPESVRDRLFRGEEEEEDDGEEEEGGVGVGGEGEQEQPERLPLSPSPVAVTTAAISAAINVQRRDSHSRDSNSRENTATTKDSKSDRSPSLGDGESTLGTPDFASLMEPAKFRLKLFLTDGTVDVGGGQTLNAANGHGKSLSTSPNNANNGKSSNGQEQANKPIADLFPYCTVLFADIAGFTAWSSLRDPAQVFTLLEAIYQAFDRIARKRCVFKVETVGDSYVAVTGLPDRQDDHALVMSRFARDCRTRMNEVTRKLEVTLGPDTADLRMRFGLNSGPVTAGVLRGSKSRFQLFGDTVNTAARMESTGERDRIQVSQSTADLLHEAGKGHWLTARDELVHAKGKGELQTYWLETLSSGKKAMTTMDNKSVNSFNSLNSEDSSASRNSSRRLSNDSRNNTNGRRFSNGSLGRRFSNGSHGGSRRYSNEPLISLSNSSRGGQEKLSVLWGINEELPEYMQTQRSKHQRLIDYNVDLLSQHLKRIVARRMVRATAVARRSSIAGDVTSRRRGSGATRRNSAAARLRTTTRRRHSSGGGFALRESSNKNVVPPDLADLVPLSIEETTVLDEVTEVIKLPSFDPDMFKGRIDPNSIDLDPAVTSQLKRFVTVIAAMYRTNPFHNFSHASHVCMSVNKLLQRVVTPDISLQKENNATTNGRSHKKELYTKLHNELHQYTYGITSDPLTQFAIVFSALIHDVDHWGVSNSQLIKEGAEIADRYKKKSIAEQNSVDLAWDLLMDADEYGELQRCIFASESEYARFRQVVVNVVMATDIFDKELGELRRNRWDKAFQGSAILDADHKDRKATIVIEHIMQASDVAHTMQHWHVYQKWNRRLFDEMYTAFKCGRAEKDPSLGWYKGEIWFFDNYVIPLAYKLKECGVFGVAGDECLNYALDNKREWAAKGQTLVEEMVASYNAREIEEERAPKQTKRSRYGRRQSLKTSSG